MDHRILHRDAGIAPTWVESLRKAAESLGWKEDPVVLRGWMTGTEVVTCVRSLGGTVTPGEPFLGWTLAIRDHGNREPIQRYAPELLDTSVQVEDFHGIMVLALDGEQFLAMRTNEQIFHGQVERALFLAGRSLESVLRMAGRLKAQRNSLFKERIRVYGADAKPTNVAGVTEDDLILPEDFKRDLLGYLDGFWRSAELCARMRIAVTRGVLLVGAPGTGKTMTVRHIMERYAMHQRFIFVTESAAGARNGEPSFRVMLNEIVETNAPAVVVIEDIDRLLDSGGVTAEFLLNVLDGVFQPVHPVLWVATSNDPSKLEQNLLDRPGRFDRILVFPVPSERERVMLLRRYSPWPLEEAVLLDIAQRSISLTGAHLRELCYAAAIAAADLPGRYSAALRAEVGRLVGQHNHASRYELTIAQRTVGFVG